MAPSVTSKTLKELFAELGFEDDKFPGRDQKDIRKALAKVPIKALTLGNPALFWNVESDKAKALAYEFCQGSQRAKTLWPYSPGKGWPVWNSDEPKIISLLAHVLCLKAYYKYHNQKEGVGEKLRDTEGTEDSADSMEKRELSPEFRGFSSLAPPRGTKKRPSKRSHALFTDFQEPNTSEPFSPPSLPTSANEEATSSMEFLELCIEHIDSLAPTNGTSPLTSFSNEWIERWQAECPPNADSQILTFMHENNMYDPEAEDRKVVKLIGELLRGSELETRSASQYNTIELRVLKRINKLSRKMFNDGLVVSGLDGKYGKSRTFAEYWENRHSFWDAEPSTTKDDSHHGTTSSPTQDDISKILAPLTNGNSPVVRPVRRSAISTSETSSKCKALKASSSSSPVTSDPSNFASENDESSRSPKRAKHARSRNPEEQPNTSVQSQNSERLVDGEEYDNVSPTPNGVDNVSGDVPLIRSGAFPPDTVSKIQDARPMTPPPRLERSIHLRRIMTPMSPTPTVGTLRHESVMFRTPPPSGHNNTPSSQLLSPALSASGSEAEIYLTIRDQNGKYDTDHPIFASRLRNCSLNTLFAIISEQSGVPYDSLSCLTFRSVFATSFSTNIMDVLEKDGQEEMWHDLKTKMVRRYRHAKSTKPEHDDFEVLVDIGNTTDVIWENAHKGGF